MILGKRGFTLVEMIVVMAVFMAVLIISATAFNTIIVQSSKLFKSEESNIEGVVGLEMMRHDLQQAGYGLFSEPATYADEASVTPASAYNDAPDKVPRPIVAGNDLPAGTTSGSNTILTGSDYLAIKGTTVGRTKAAQKWTFLKFSSGDVKPHNWASAAENFESSEKVVLIKKQFGTPVRSTLVLETSDDYYYTYSDTAFQNLSSTSNGIYTVYGVDKAEEDELRFPFNRSDYFVARPDSDSTIPAFCAPGTGMLYKATVKHDGGGLSSIPVLDCVLDMQVVLGWDIDSDGLIDTWSNADGTAFTGLGPLGTVKDAAGTTNTNNNSLTTLPNIRNNLKIVKIYILAQNGKKDTGYTSISPLDVSDTAEASLTRPAGFTLATNQLNYRWKLYRIVVKPKNLLSNQ